MINKSAWRFRFAEKVKRKHYAASPNILSTDPLAQLAVDFARAADEPARHVAEAAFTADQQLSLSRLNRTTLGRGCAGELLEVQTLQIAGGDIDEQRLVEHNTGR